MEKDLVNKRYFSDNGRYADLINGFVFHGRQEIRGDLLADMDTQTVMQENHSLYGRNEKRRGKYRDLVRKASVGINFAVIGIEKQEEVHYLMPLRSMGYDLAEYERQAKESRKKIQKEKGISSAEFLSGFRKDNRLYPCITFVLFFGRTWDGSRDLHGILDFTDIPDELKKMINNYQIHLLEVHKLKNTAVFQTDLKQVFDFIRYSENKEKLRELVEKDMAYREMDEDAYDMAVTYADAKELISIKKLHEKEGKVDMCKALTELIADGREEGIKEGMAAGIRLTKEIYRLAGEGMEIHEIAKRMDISVGKTEEILKH